MESLEQKQLGLRLKAIRILTGLNQEEFAKACAFNHTSLRNWEFGRVAPRKEAIDRLVAAFREFSIFVDREWIFFGKGEGPVFTANISGMDAPIWHDEISAFKNTCTAMGENALVLHLDDDEMLPHHAKGDWVGGISRSLRGLSKINSAAFLAKPMLVKLEDKRLYLRYVCREGEVWFAKSNGSYHLSRIIGDLVGIVVFHMSSAPGNCNADSVLSANNE